MPPMKYWEVIADKVSAAGWAIVVPRRALFLLKRY